MECVNPNTLYLPTAVSIPCCIVMLYAVHSNFNECVSSPSVFRLLSPAGPLLRPRKAAGPLQQEPQRGRSAHSAGPLQETSVPTANAHRWLTHHTVFALCGSLRATALLSLLLLPLAPVSRAEQCRAVRCGAVRISVSSS